MNARIPKTPVAVGMLLVLLACCSRSAAAESTAQAKAAAEALFQNGTELAARGNLAQACEKFEASQELDPAPGTMLRLADCYDRVGKTASAWAWFHQVLSLTRGERNDRASVAAERVRDLESRLAKIDIQVPLEARISGLEVRLNGTIVPATSWGMPLPVDPGQQHLDFSAPRYQRQVDNVLVSSGPSTQAVVVPRLVPLASSRLASPSSDTGAKAIAVHGDLSAPPDVLGTVHPPPERRWERTMGYALGGAGIVGLGLGAFFAYRAYDTNQLSLEHCSSRNANACTPEGKAARDDAQSYATASTVTVVAGTALIGVGAVLVLFSPRANERGPSNRNVSGRLRFATVRSAASLAFEGQW